MIKFLKGTAAEYTLATKDTDTFYFTTDDNQFYLGEVKLSNATEIAEAVLSISQNTTDIASIKSQLETLLGTGGEGTSIESMIEEAIEELETKIGDLDTLETTAKSDLVAAINEVRAAISAGGTEAQITIDTSTTTEGYAKSYTIKQGESTVGVIDIPKDMVVSSGTVETNPDGQAEGTYLVLTLANADSDKVYINVGTLVDIYVAQESATQVQLTINSSTREISATIVAGSISATELADSAVTTAKIADGNVTLAKLATSVQTSLGLADSALQSSDIVTGSTNGTISVDGTDVAVAGLGTAAYADADTISQEAKDYADGLASNYATAAQGALADTALQASDITTGTTNGTIAVDGTNVSVYGLGSAAYTASSAYDAAGSASTAEQNAKDYADSLLEWGSI